MAQIDTRHEKRNSEEFAYLKEKDRLQTLLMDNIEALLQQNRMMALFTIVAELIQESIGLYNVWAFEVNETRKEPYLIASYGPHFQDTKKHIPFGADGDGRFIKNLWEKFEFDVIEDCRQDKHLDQAYIHKYGCSSLVHVPLRLSAEKIGMFGCASFQKSGTLKITPAQKFFLEKLAGLLALAIKRINTAHASEAKQKVLTEAVQSWESFARNTNDIILHVDEKGHILYLNRDSEQPVYEKTIFDFLPIKEEHAKVKNALAYVFKNASPTSYQVTGLNIAGSQAIYFSRISPVFIKEKLVYASIVSSDFTDAIHTRQALEISEFRYRSMIDNSPSNIYIKDLDGCYIDVNKTYLKSLGFKKNNVIGKDDYHLFPPDTAKCFRDNDKKVLTQGRAIEFEEIVPAGGDEIIFLTVKYPLFTPDKEAYAIGGISTNITSRIRSRIRVQESEKRYRELADNSPLAIVIHKKNKILYANRASLQLIGASNPTQLIGKDIMKFIHSSSLNDVKQQVHRIYTRQGNSRPMDHKLITLQGNIRIVEMAGTMIDYNGQPASQVILRDVTLNKQWEKVLSRYEHIVNSTNDKLSFVDRDYIYRAVNKSYYTMHGEKNKKIVGHSIEELFGKDIFEKNIRPHFDRCLQGETINYQYWFDFENVGKRFMDVSYFPYREKDDSISGVVVSSHDITERKLVEDELVLLNKVINASTSGLSYMEMMETACRDLAQSFDANQVVISLLNPSGDALQVATAWPEDIRDTKTGFTFPTKDIPLLKKFYKNPDPLMVENVKDFDQLGIYKKMLAEQNMLSVLILPLSSDNHLIGVISLDCIRKRKFKTKQIKTIERIVAQLSAAIGYVELQEQQKRMAAALEQTFENIIITDSNGVVVYVNPAFEQTTGYLRNEVIGRKVGPIKSDRHDQTFYQELWQTIKAGKVWRGRFINRKKSSEIYYEDATITPIRNDIGEIINFVSVQHDVTRELELEKQLRQSQKMDAVGQLVGGVAHDFNNLLTSIMSYAGFALEFSDVPLSSRTAEDLRGILRSAERAAKLTRQLLTFAKKQVTTPKIIDINQSISEMEDMLSRLINENIKLTTRLEPALKTIKIDPAQFEQVLVNLVVNARDAMPDGGKIVIETHNHLEPSSAGGVRKAGAYVLLKIKDSGTGIPEQIQDRIFEPFFTTKPASEGTGLGLSTCFGIISNHGGTIDLESQTGMGTVFRIYFPVNSANTKDNKAKSGTQAVEGGNECILLVEDENALREVTARGLRQKGYKVLEAGNGKEALDLIITQPEIKFDLLLSDVVMPEIGGKKLIRLVNMHFPEVKIILMSGYAEIELDTKQENLLFIQKPFLQDTLYKIVRNLLDKN